jgi:hypothetical protein
MKNRNILFTTILLVLACFALSPRAQAVSPAPDGGYAVRNTAEGDSALLSLTPGGTDNTAIGWSSLKGLKTGVYNTAIGSGALIVNTANFNTATGAAALWSNTSGAGNTAHGFSALWHNLNGGSNTAIGFQALFNNTGGSGISGAFNTAVGANALYSNIAGFQNTAIGESALLNNTATGNTAVGVSALRLNTTHIYNTAIGTFALYNNDADANTATGYAALGSNTSGTNNTAVGVGALGSNTTGSDNVAIGLGALPQNTNGCNIAVGENAAANLTGNNSGNIDIGNVGLAGDFGTIRIGQPGIFACNQARTFIAGIYGVNEGGTILPVYINSDGQLGTASSSRRFKKEIKSMDQASEAILSLKPVTFHYKSDKTGTPQFGLIAEEVAEVNPDLVVRDEKGEIYTVRYDAVNAMLLNEFLKEHRTVQELKSTVVKQEATITQLKSGAAKQDATIAALTASLKEQAAQIQKVSAQVEVSRPAPQTVLNNQ